MCNPKLSELFRAMQNRKYLSLFFMLIPMASIGAEENECGQAQPVIYEEPDYPIFETSEPSRGTVVFEYIIDRDGSVVEIGLNSVKASGQIFIVDEYFEAAAMSLQSWKYMERAAPCKHKTSFTVEFEG